MKQRLLQTLRWSFLGVGIAVIGIFGPVLAIKAIENWAMIRLLEGLQRSQEHFDMAAKGEPVLFDTLSSSSDFPLVLNLLQTARRFQPSSADLEWTIGRFLSALGMTDVAGDVFDQITPWAEEHLFARFYAVFYASLDNNDRLVLDLGSRMPDVSELADQSVTVAMLRSPSDSSEAERSLLEAALAWEPTSLEAIFRLYGMSKREEEEGLREQLRQFSIEAISSRHPLLFNGVLAVLRQMEQQGIISDETSANILKYYIWQNTNNEQVIAWLNERLNHQTALTAADHLLLAESYDRRGELSLAIEAYLSLVDDPILAPQAALRLVQLCVYQAQCDSDTMKAAARSLQAAAPIDQAAYMLWSSICATEWWSSATAASAACSEQQDVSLIDVPLQEGKLQLTTGPDLGAAQSAAKALNVQLNDLVVGSNLLTNGSFEEGLDHWRVVRTLGNNYSLGAFGIGTDMLSKVDGNDSLRIDGLWLDIENDKSIGRSGVQSVDDEGNTRTYTVEPGQCLLARGSYKTAGAIEVPLLLLSGELTTILPPTDGTWHLANLSYCNEREIPLEAIFSVRLRSVGQLWLDEWSLQTVDTVK